VGVPVGTIIGHATFHLGHHLRGSPTPCSPGELGQQELLQAHTSLGRSPSERAVDLVGNVTDLDGRHHVMIALVAL
jgi:hypothetical protein